MASRRVGVSDRIRFGLRVQGGWPPQTRPLGVTSGRWILLGPVWVRLGRRSSWAGEDQDAKMIKPVEP